MLVRPAVLEDYPTARAIFVESWTQLALSLGLEPARAELDSWPVFPTLVAEVNSTLVGFAQLNKNVLQRLYVLPAWKSRGAGGGLLLEAHSLNVTLLQVDEQNFKARCFYERYGWAWTGQREPGYLFPESSVLTYKRQV